MKFQALLLFIPLVPAPAFSQDIVGRRERTYSVSERIAEGGNVAIHTTVGNITVTESASRNLEFRAEKDDRRGSIEDIGFIVRKQEGGLTICAVYSDDDDCTDRGIQNERRSWRSNQRRATVRVTVSIPKGVHLRISTGNGDANVSVGAAEATVSSGNGDVRTSGVLGRLQISTGNGEVTVTDAGGPVRASSGNGDISVQTAKGPVTASTGNGDIAVDMFKMTSDEDMEFSTGNGHIEIVAPADFSARVEATTGSGRISTDFPITLSGRLSPTRLRGTIGNGRQRLQLSSGNGSIEIRKR